MSTFKLTDSPDLNARPLIDLITLIVLKLFSASLKDFTGLKTSKRLTSRYFVGTF